jgi:hypothetical protein
MDKAMDKATAKREMAGHWISDLAEAAKTHDQMLLKREHSRAQEAAPLYGGAKPRCCACFCHDATDSPCHCAPPAVHFDPSKWKSRDCWPASDSSFIVLSSAHVM